MATPHELPDRGRHRGERRHAPLRLHVADPGDGDRRERGFARSAARILRAVGRRVRILPAWFAGADLRLLSESPSEHIFYNALGSAVFVLECGNGFSFCVAAAYMVQTAPSRIWWLGVAWALVMICIERLVLQLPATRKRWLPLVIVPRVLLSFLIAIQLGEPIVLLANQGEITNYISNQQTTVTKGAVGDINHFYGTKIAADQKTIAEIEQHESNLRARRDHFKFLSECENDTPSCSITHRPGCGTFCLHYRQLAQDAQNQLDAIKSQDQAKIAALNTEIASLQTTERNQRTGRVHAIAGDGGLLAQEEALAALEKAHPEVLAEVWFLRIFLVVLDLVPLSMKVVRILAGGSPLDEITRAAKDQETLRAVERDVTTKVEKDSLEQQGLADMEVNRDEIWRRAERRRGVVGDDDVDAESWSTHYGGGEPVNAWSLDELVDRSTSHEAHPVPVPSELRRGGLVGLALLAALALATNLWTSFTHQPVAGGWLTIVALVLGVVLAAFTRGFHTASAWGLRAILATLIAGLLLPIVIVAMNVV